VNETNSDRLPCPICGEPPEEEWYFGSAAFKIFCKSDHQHHVYVLCHDQTHAEALWNKRACPVGRIMQEALEKDKERLDWLEKSAESVRLYKAAWEEYFLRRSMREAVDEASKKEQSK